MPTKEIKIVKKRNQPVQVRTASVRSPRRSAAVESFRIPEGMDGTENAGRTPVRHKAARHKAGTVNAAVPAKKAGRRS
jgi:hypothetical protein